MSHHADKPSDLVFPGGERCQRLGRTDFGSFSPETTDGAEMLAQIGRSGMFGKWLADQLVDEAERQRSELAAREFAGSIATSFQPHPPEIYGQWFVLHAMTERIAVGDGNVEAAMQARQVMISAGEQLVADGLATRGEAERMQLGALQQAQAQMN